jgi:hypothetical protein
MEIPPLVISKAKLNKARERTKPRVFKSNPLNCVGMRVHMGQKQPKRTLILPPASLDSQSQSPNSCENQRIRFVTRARL